MLFPIRYLFDSDVLKIVVALDKYIKNNNIEINDDTMISVDIVQTKDANNIQKLLNFKD